MATTSKTSGRISIAIAMENNTPQSICPQGIPPDILVQVGHTSFSLHKFMLAAKSNYIRKLILQSKEADLSRIDLTDIPGGGPIFDKAAKFCYGVNFEITVQNVAPLLCAAHYLEMIDNLAARTHDFLSQVALKTLSGTLLVLKSSQNLLPLADDLRIVHTCLDFATSHISAEAVNPTRSPSNWWAQELTILDITFFTRLLATMKSRGSNALILATAIIAYAERSLGDLVRNHSGTGKTSSDSWNADTRAQQRQLLHALVALLPTEKSVCSINFLCCLLRAAIFLRADDTCKNELEKRISVILEHVTVDELLVLSFTYDGETLFDLESIRRIISGFVEKEKSVAVFNTSQVCSTTMQRVAKTVDAYLGEIATHVELSTAKFNAIANLVPKEARKGHDDLYRAVDIFLKAHPHLDELEREKACSVMDPRKLSEGARVHASKNKRLPLQIVLHALCYDQLKSRSGGGAAEIDYSMMDAAATRNKVQADVSLIEENEALKNELQKMKMYIKDVGNSPQVTTSSRSSVKKTTFFSSMSKTLGRMNPFKDGSKDTSNIDDMKDFTKPRRRRFSIS